MQCNMLGYQVLTKIYIFTLSLDPQFLTFVTSIHIYLFLPYIHSLLSTQNIIQTQLERKSSSIMRKTAADSRTTGTSWNIYNLCS